MLKSINEIMTTQEKLDKFALEIFATDWDGYLNWMINSMHYTPEQITQRIIDALK